MATTTRVLDANVNGTVYTSNANDALEALDTCHSGATAPTDEVANGKLWLDTSTTPGVLKIYNNATWVAVVSSTTVEDAGGLLAANNLSDVASASTSLSNLGLSALAAEINVLDGITASTAELNTLTGLTSSTLELNTLDGITATVTELNYTDGVTSNIQVQLNAVAAGVISTSADPDFTVDPTLLATRATIKTFVDAIPSGAPTTTEVLSATAGATAGAVGTYAFMEDTGSNVGLDIGDTVAGSGIRYAGVAKTETSPMDISSSSTVPSGTWRCMGYIPTVFIATAKYASLFLRIV